MKEFVNQRSLSHYQRPIHKNSATTGRGKKGAVVLHLDAFVTAESIQLIQ
jgi:hypothetical protein